MVGNVVLEKQSADRWWLSAPVLGGGIVSVQIWQRLVCHQAQCGIIAMRDVLKVVVPGGDELIMVGGEERKREMDDCGMHRLRI